MTTIRQRGGVERRSVAVLGAMLGLALWAGLGMLQVEAADNPTIKIENFSFAPENLTVPVGTTVTWVNGDDIPHTIVLSDKSFHSKPLDSGDKATFTFAKAGEIPYFCGLHPHMTGKITVVP